MIAAVLRQVDSNLVAGDIPAEEEDIPAEVGDIPVEGSLAVVDTLAVDSWDHMVEVLNNIREDYNY